MKPTALDQAPATELARTAYDHLGALVRVEVALAWCDARDELRSLRRAAVLAVLAYGAAVAALTLLAVAAVLASGATALGALVAAGAVALAAGALGWGAARSVSLAPMEKTRARLQEAARHLKETIP